ncbi:hypothetical protein AB3S75_009811 [Citrus x aurantiifolia]
MASEEPKQSLRDQKEPNPVAGNGQNTESLFSPRFKSVAAMAGWDEEAILVASLVVEDTPDRESKQKRRFDLPFKTPPSNSRRKRRLQKRSPVSIPIAVLDLDEGESSGQESGKNKVQLNEEKKTKEEKSVGGDELAEPSNDGSSSSSVLTCIDKLREELSCAICLEICFEPSTTTCGHSFCKKCLRYAADKCGKKCPKCRQLISNGRSCTVNTVLWNTIQLLFPQEVEARKAAAAALNSREAEHQSPQRGFHNNVRTRSMRSSATSSGDATTRRREIPNQDEYAASTLRFERENFARLISISVDSLEAEDQNPQRRSTRPSTVSTRDRSTRRRGIPSQDEDAALAIRLQREEFMEAFMGTREQHSGSSLSLARANLRAMASRAINIRMRGRPL